MMIFAMLMLSGATMAGAASNELERIDIFLAGKTRSVSISPRDRDPWGRLAFVETDDPILIVPEQGTPDVLLSPGVIGLAEDGKTILKGQLMEPLELPLPDHPGLGVTLAKGCHIVLYPNGRIMAGANRDRLVMWAAGQRGGTGETLIHGDIPPGSFLVFDESGQIIARDLRGQVKIVSLDGKMSALWRKSVKLPGTFERIRFRRPSFIWQRFDDEGRLVGIQRLVEGEYRCKGRRGHLPAGKWLDLKSLDNAR